MYILALPLIFAAIACAQEPTQIPVFLYDTDPQELVASVIDVQAATTTLQISCPPGGDASECGYGPGARVLQAENFAAGEMVEEGAFTMTWQCQLVSSTVSAVCTVSAGGPAANFPGLTTETLTGSQVQYIPVTVTAGQSKLAPTAGGTDTATAKTTSASSLPQNTGSTTESNGPAETNKPGSAPRLESSLSLGLLAIIAALPAILL